jgi:hypothetical protein
MKGKKGIANEFQMDFKNVDFNSENVVERNSKSMQFSFFEPTNKVQSFFQNAHKTSLFISFTSLIVME